MRKIVVTMWLTVDGYIAGPKGDMGFVHRAFGAEMGVYEANLVGKADALMLGRRTYDSFASSWPKVPDMPNISEGEKKYAKKLNSMHKYVFSRKLKHGDWNNSEVFNTISAKKIKDIKKKPGKDIVIYGSASVIQELTNLGLIDEYQLLVHPDLLGEGKKLFDNIDKEVILELSGVKKFKSGVVLLTYALKK